MTVEELLEDLRLLPRTAVVVVRIRKTENTDARENAPKLVPLYEWRDAPVLSAVYDLGEVYLDLEE